MLEVFTSFLSGHAYGIRAIAYATSLPLSLKNMTNEGPFPLIHPPTGSVTLPDRYRYR